MPGRHLCLGLNCCDVASHLNVYTFSSWTNVSMRTVYICTLHRPIVFIIRCSYSELYFATFWETTCRPIYVRSGLRHAHAHQHYTGIVYISRRSIHTSRALVRPSIWRTDVVNHKCTCIACILHKTFVTWSWHCEKLKYSRRRYRG